MSSQHKNLIRRILFAITFLCLQPCFCNAQYEDATSSSLSSSSETIELHTHQIQKHYHEKLYKHYLGCFSRNILERMVNEIKAKVILYNPFLTQEECFDACQIFFDKEYPKSLLNLIAIQHHVCICLPAYEDDQPVQLHKVPDSNCYSYTTAFRKDLVVGGSNSIALYSKDENKGYYVPYVQFDSEETSAEKDSEEDSLHNLVYVDPDSPETNISSCSTEECILRVDEDGQVCYDYDDFQILRPPQALIPFLNSYIPKSEKNPYHCADYCSSSKKYSVYSNGESSEIPHLPKYSIQSTINMKVLFQEHERIELCHCTDNLPMVYPLQFEKCVTCPEDIQQKLKYCSVYEFQHRIYKNEFRGERTVITTHSPDVDILGPGSGSGNSNNSARNTLVCSEENKCKGKDSYGYEWTACPLETKREKCPASPNGTAFWTCSANGQFAGDQPNYENCTSQDLLIIENKYTRTTFGPNSNQPKEVLLELRTLVSKPAADSKGAKYFGRDIEKIKSIVKSAVETPNADFNERESVSTEAVNVYGNLIATSGPWGQLNPRSRSMVATNLISEVEDTLFTFAEASKTEIFDRSPENFYRKTIKPIDKDPNGFKVTLGGRKKFIREDITFPADSSSGTSITIPDNIHLQQENLQYVGMIMESKYVNQLTPPQLMPQGQNSPSSKTFNGKIISLSFSNTTITQLATENGVQVKFVHEVEAVGKRHIDFRRKLHPGEIGKYVLGETKCAYWDTSRLVWSTKGCEKLENPSNSKETICKCDHLTAFAVLTDVHGYIGKEKGLEIVTLILCALSIFCLIATIVILTRMKVLHGERTTITKHLCVTLILGNLLMLLFVDKDYFFLSEIGCTIVGIVTHYVYLAAFGWMAVQGFYLYRMVVLIFDSGKNYMPFYTIGAYFVPLLPVGLTAAIGYGVGDQPYGGEMYCWLNGDYIWAFMGPVAVVLFGNFLMMAVTLRKVRKQQSSKFRAHAQVSANRKWLQGCFALSVLFGLTWITGFFTLLDEPSFHFFAYVFTIMNASQGIFILIFYCLLHEKVKPLLMDKMGKLGIVSLKKKGSISSTSKKTSSTRLPQSRSQQDDDNLSQTENIGTDHEETEALRGNSIKMPTRNVYDESRNQSQGELFSGRALSTVLEYNSDYDSEEESEDNLLSESGGRKPKPKPRRQMRIEEVFESDEYSESENEDLNESGNSGGQGPEQRKGRKRRYRGPPYMDELVESNLFRQMSQASADDEQ